MTQLATGGARVRGFGATMRRDGWWVGPLLTFLVLLSFVIYATWAGLQGTHFEIREHPDFTGRPVAPYLSPFYSPLIYDAVSPHAWITLAEGETAPGWWPSWFPRFSAAILILAGPVLFRFTCYYSRKAYYRAFWADPPACAVGEPRKNYWGENHWPLLGQNAHRYFLYIALGFLIILWWDTLLAFWWPTDRGGQFVTGGQFGVGVGTLVMLANIILLTGYTLGCHSLRHLVGGRLNNFACFACVNGKVDQSKLRTGYRLWRINTMLNERHALWAWLSLFSVGLTDVYIRLCSTGVIHDVRIV